MDNIAHHPDRFVERTEFIISVVAIKNRQMNKDQLTEIKKKGSIVAYSKK